jgi:hypothetical protein
MVEMEIGAGYELKSIVCQNGDRDIDAYGFHYVGSPRGKLIEGGDWVKAVSKMRTIDWAGKELDEEWA